MATAVYEADDEDFPNPERGFFIQRSYNPLREGTGGRPLNIIDLSAARKRGISLLRMIAFLEAGFVGAWGEWHSSTQGLFDCDPAASRTSPRPLKPSRAASTCRFTRRGRSRSGFRWARRSRTR
jgi:hypothetical protein